MGCAGFAAKQLAVEGIALVFAEGTGAVLAGTANEGSCSHRRISVTLGSP